MFRNRQESQADLIPNEDKTGRMTPELLALFDPNFDIGAAAFSSLVMLLRDPDPDLDRHAESLRGLPPPSDGGGCGDCSVSGEPDASTPLMAFTMLLGMVGLLRRRRD